MQSDTLRITLLVIDAFDQIGIPYAVCGSLSSSMHGVMRSTMDADIIADIRTEHIQPLIAALSAEFYADDEMIRSAIVHYSSFNLIHYDTAFKVDIFVPKSRAFDRMQLDRRTAATVSTDPQRSIYITSAEDIILAKLEWFRMGGEVSDRQWRDILGVIQMKAEQLDLPYLRQTAVGLGVLDLLERALGV